MNSAIQHSPTSVAIRVGRLASHPDGGWIVRTDDGSELMARDGSGLTKHEAEQLLDELDQFVAARGGPGCEPNPPVQPSGGVSPDRSVSVVARNRNSSSPARRNQPAAGHLE